MQPKNYDSEFCGRVPIHLTNQIQSYGALLVVDAEKLHILQVSENVDLIFGKSHDQLVNTTLADHVDAKVIKDLKANFSTSHGERLPTQWKVNGKEYLAVVHRKDGLLLIEIDIEALSPQEEDSFIQVYQRLKYSMSAIESAGDLRDICAVAAREIKRISGFDKVMIYRFDSEWNGNVLAEEAAPDMEKYLNLTFPASDIPAQARKLYERSPYRYIPDRNYKPVGLYPVLNPLTNSFTDLSDCNVRSVASVHLEYLKNMNVAASMSTRIMHHDKLWGLIACHHRTSKTIDYQMCSIFEMFSRIISMKITSVENQQVLNIENTLATDYSHLIESIFRTGDLDSELLKDSGVLKLFKATGAVVCRGGRYSTAGTVPAQEHLDELVLWLHTHEPRKVLHTSNLIEDYEYARDYQEIGSGLLVIPINHTKDEYLIVFRPEKIREINWGGNPDERIQFGPGENVYHPRNSFRLWQEKVSGTSQEWNSAELRFAETLRSFLYEYETSSSF